MKIITDTAGLVVMVTENASPTPPEGGALYVLTPGQEEEYKQLAAAPNNGILFVGGVLTAKAPLPVLDPTAYYALIDRRARAAERRGDDVAAIKLRMGG